MTEKMILFTELQEHVLAQLTNQSYMDSTLNNYRRIYNRVHVFLNAHNTEYYTVDAGREFLESTNVSNFTYRTYACAIRRLNEYTHGKPYRCHHGNPKEKPTEVFDSVLTDFLDNCKYIGNKPATILKKGSACTLFLNYIEQSGCRDLSTLDTGLVSKALLQFSNKDNYAIIRIFLRYLADKGIIVSDLSGIVPKYKRQKILPTTYTPNEIMMVENAINTKTDTGKRDIAIIRLATRMGMRAGDIAKLTWEEIDFSSSSICYIQEKTGVPLSLQMPSEVSASLFAHLENTKFESKDGYVFHSMSAPYGRITTSVIRHAVINAFTRAGINISGKKHGPHAFRSSLASSMINDGASFETVRQILGHSDPNVIKHYARTDIERLRLCAIDAPMPTGLFEDYLKGKKVIDHV